MARYDGLISGRTARLPKPETIDAFCEPYTTAWRGLRDADGQRIGIRDDLGGPIHVLVYGTPIAWVRMTQQDKWRQRPRVVRYREWCDRLRAVTGEIPPAETINVVSGTAYFEPPKSWTKKHRLEMVGQRHTARPDADNLAKAVLDALWSEDSGIFLGPWKKFWDLTPRLEIEITLR